MRVTDASIAAFFALSLEGDAGHDIDF